MFYINPCSRSFYSIGLFQHLNMQIIPQILLKSKCETLFLSKLYRSNALMKIHIILISLFMYYVKNVLQKSLQSTFYGIGLFQHLNMQIIPQILLKCKCETLFLFKLYRINALMKIHINLISLFLYYV